MDSRPTESLKGQPRLARYVADAPTEKANVGPEDMIMKNQDRRGSSRAGSSGTIRFALIATLCMASHAALQAQTPTLHWSSDKPEKVTCVYGKITVLASVPNIYFCGAEWYGVDGYSGIQHWDTKPWFANIFAVWNTSPKQHASIIEADPEAKCSKFGGEGEGVHANMLGVWKTGHPYQFFLQKVPGAKRDTTDTRYYYFDHSKKVWRHMATIHSANGKENAGTSFDGTVSWIENYGDDPKSGPPPKVALYSLWAGTSVDKLERVTRANGEKDTRWGQWHGEYFLASGDSQQLAAFYAKHEKKYGKPIFGKDDKELPPLKEEPLPVKILQELKSLPHAPAFTGKLK